MPGPQTRPAAGAAVRFDPPPRATLAAVQLPTDLTLESEGPSLLARLPGVQLRLGRLALDGTSLDPGNYATGRGRIAEAAARLQPVGSLDVIGLSCTSLACSLGREAVQAEMASAQPGARVTDMASAVLAALAQVGARRLAVLTPYQPALHAQLLGLLEDEGHDIVAEQALGLSDDAEISAVSRASLVELACAADHADADALLIACSALRVCVPGLLDELEDRLGKPVVSSQQAFLWQLLRLAGVDDRVGGYGRLLAGRRGWDGAPAPATRVPVQGGPEDCYPSRVPEPGLVRRVDPTVDASESVPGPLDAGQVEQFGRRGAVVLPQVFAPDEVAHLREAVDGLRRHYEGLSHEELDQATDMRVISERGGALVGQTGERPVLKSIWQIHLPPEHAPHLRQAGPLLRRLICDARLVDAARQLLGEEVYIHQSRINFQAGWRQGHRGGTGFLWHQDFEQWHSEDGMPRMRSLSMAVLLDRSQPANGALMVMPGSHRAMVQAYGQTGADDRYARGALSSGPELPAELLAELADRHGISYCRGEPGDVVLFDCNTVHGSHSNISPWNRCMAFAVYNAVSNTCRPRPFAAQVPRPEHIGSHDPRWAGVPLPSLRQSLASAASPGSPD